MKTTKKVIALLCAIFMVMSVMFLTGCGKKDKDLENELENALNSLVESIDSLDIAGKYELVEMTSEGASYGKDELDAMKTLGFVITMELKDDGTGTMDIYGEVSDLEYDEDTITIDGDATPYTKSGDRITIEQDDSKMVFEKVTE